MTEVQPKSGASNKDVLWYIADVGPIPGPARDLLENYSGIHPDHLIDHVTKVREKAWSVAPYPCIGSFVFLRLGIHTSPLYASIIQRIRNGETLLDLGCCFGQDIRRIVHDGAPSENIYGLDVKQELMDCGYDLFLDRGRLKSTFVEADLLQDSDALDKLEGKFDIIFAASVFHIFDWEKQMKIARECVKLLRRKPGSLLLGHHLGHIEPGHYLSGLDPDDEAYGQNESSWQRMWDLVGQDTDSKWKCESTMEDLSNPAAFRRDGGWGDEGRKLMKFTVVRE